MKFEWKKQGKLLDRLESEATETAEEVIKSFFGVAKLKQKYAQVSLSEWPGTSLVSKRNFSFPPTVGLKLRYLKKNSSG